GDSTGHARQTRQHDIHSSSRHSSNHQAETHTPFPADSPKLRKARGPQRLAVEFRGQIQSQRAPSQLVGPPQAVPGTGGPGQFVKVVRV
ncbi:hypothetical protein, partial [Streptomyces sp. NPDC051016]|uniref:hypothetical protein n=1 Tax=Streptomyces sp. NPDC051016 TaxID=3365638 RepID=UPI0037B1B1FC